MTRDHRFMLVRPRRWDATVALGDTARMDTTDTWPPPDPLGEALHLLRMSGAFYTRSELSAPWGMTLHPMPGYLWFHVVTAGRVLLDVDEQESRWLHPGDLALVPHGNGHGLRSEPGADAPQILDLDLQQLTERYELIRHGGGGAPTTLICGAVRFDHPAARNLVGMLPQIIAIEASDAPRATWMQGVFGLMALEAREFRPGG
jgi:mannose-6-phosphate isomerase-like protein (cupin superfamily)